MGKGQVHARATAPRARKAHSRGTTSPLQVACHGSGVVAASVTNIKAGFFWGVLCSAATLNFACRTRVHRVHVSIDDLGGRCTWVTALALLAKVKQTPCSATGMPAAQHECTSQARRARHVGAGGGTCAHACMGGTRNPSGGKTVRRAASCWLTSGAGSQGWFAGWFMADWVGSRVGFAWQHMHAHPLVRFGQASARHAHETNARWVKRGHDVTRPSRAVPSLHDSPLQGRKAARGRAQQCAAAHGSALTRSK